MRILIDAHMVGERETGNETYVVNLVRGLLRLDAADEYLLATADPAALAERIPPGPRVRFATVSRSPWKRLFVDLPGVARREMAELAHTTYAGPPFCPCPVVTTVHDVSYREHPEWFSLRDRLVLESGVGCTMKRAAHILTVSQFSKEEICRLYRIPEARVSVTYEAASAAYRPCDADDDGKVLAKLGIVTPYVLAVGNVQPRKNLARTLEAFALLVERGERAHRLVIAGKDSHRSSEIHRAVNRLNLAERVRFTGYVTEAELAALYRRATAFCYASLYEGFGLPILEAMASGTALVTSNVASMREVAGDAARLVDPRDVHGIAQGLWDVLHNDALRRELRARGLNRARRFSWDDMASDTRAIYAQVLNHASR